MPVTEDPWRLAREFPDLLLRLEKFIPFAYETRSTLHAASPRVRNTRPRLRIPTLHTVFTTTFQQHLSAFEFLIEILQRRSTHLLRVPQTLSEDDIGLMQFETVLKKKSHG